MVTRSVSSVMKAIDEKIQVSDSIGNVSARIIHASEEKAVMVLAHGAGAGMDHPFMKALSDELARYHITTVRFNFPYMEKGGKRPDPPPIAERTVRAVIERSVLLFPNLPVVAGGKSFGGRMTSQLLCKHTIPEVRAIVFYGFPLHAPGNPGTQRADHLSGIKVPMLFMQGTKDQLAHLNLVKEVCHKLPNATLTIFENADHSFKIGKKDSIVDLAKKTDDWLKSLNIL
jgi:uncharacterized protein